MKKAKTVSELGVHIGFWMRLVSNHVSGSFARRLVDSGVTVAEWVVLREMFDKSDMSPSRLADLTGMTRGAASKLIDRLVVKKLISRQGRIDDRRFQDIELTSAGRGLVPLLAAIADKNDKECFNPLSENERVELVAILRKLREAHGLHQIPTE